MVYCVMTIANGRIVYDGPGIYRAAKALVPGTCYGKAPTWPEALRACRKGREMFLEVQRKLEA